MASVLLFHVFPAAVPGGYVGVDVFFVVSGFLITQLLLRQVELSGRVLFLTFYVRRIQRLLPAALVVLAAVAACLPLLPESRWLGTANEIAASALYVENWYLASQAVDYLSAETAPSALQHFWSLSIEEQFYFIWPALIALAALSAKMFRAPLFAVCAVLFVIVIGVSMWFSITLSMTNPAGSYFFSHTRFWELAIGGLGAVLLPGHRSFSLVLRRLLALAGLIAIVLPAFLYSSATPFPGYAALAPVLGTLALLMAGMRGDADKHDGIASPILNHPFAQWMGDVSYSLYLWHWPLLIIYTTVVGADIRVVEGVGLIALTFVIAHVSKKVIEDRFRAGAGIRRPGLALAGAFGSIVVCAAGALAVHSVVQGKVEAVDQSIVAEYPGARVITANIQAKTSVAPYPPLSVITQDAPLISTNECLDSREETTPTPCAFGPETAPVVVALVGDSHAANWFSPLRKLTDQKGWRLVTYTKSACPFLLDTIVNERGNYEACSEWSASVLERLKADPPAILVYAHYGSLPLVGETPATRESGRLAAVRKVWSELQNVGVKVVAIRDPPILPSNPVECMERQVDCDVPLTKTWKLFGSVAAAAAADESVVLLDFDRFICPGDSCPMVIGNVVVWRDSNHITNTYVETLADEFARQFEAGVGAMGASGATSERPRNSEGGVEMSSNLRVTLECGPFEKWPAYTRLMDLQFDGVAYRGSKGVRASKWWDDWVLELEAKGAFSLTGEYSEGSDEVKRLSIKGKIINGSLDGQGMRGRRQCSVRGAMPLP